MQTGAFRRPFRGLFLATYASACCLWAGVLEGANTATPSSPAVKSPEAISAELERETNLRAQLERTLGPITAAIKQTVAGARRVKRHYPAGTPEYNQARDLYTRIRQNVAKLEAELTGAVQTVKQEDRGERAGRANKQVIADLNDALQKFDDLIGRVAPASTPAQPNQPALPPPPQAGQPAAPPPPPQAGEPAGQPTPPGLSIEPVQPEQYVQAQPPAGQVSGEIVVQVCNLFVVHTVGLGSRSVENIRGQMISQIRRQVSLPAFANA